MIFVVAFVVSLSLTLLLCGKRTKESEASNVESKDPTYASVRGVIQPGLADIAHRFRTDDEGGYIRLKFFDSFPLRPSRKCQDPLPVPKMTSLITPLSLNDDSGDYERIISNDDSDYAKVGNYSDKRTNESDPATLPNGNGEDPPYSLVNLSTAPESELEHDYSVVNRPPIPPDRTCSLPDFEPIYDLVYEKCSASISVQCDSDNYAKIARITDDFKSPDYAFIMSQ